MPPDAIRVDGIKPLVKALKAVDGEAPKQMRLVLNESGRVVLDYARPRVPSRSGAARSSLKMASTRTQVRVSAGGPRAPYYPWLDYGGRVGRLNSVVRPFIKSGRYLYPALDARRDEFQRVLADGIIRVARDAGLDVSTNG